MRQKIIFVFLLCLMSGGIVQSAAPAFACTPSTGSNDWQYAWCMLQEYNVLPVLPTPAPVVAVAKGDDPTRARDLIDAWQVLEPGSLLWYKTPYSEGFRQLEFTLETAKPDTISLAFFSPDQTQGLNPASKPIGRGTHSRGDPDNILRWKASYAKPGVWYALLVNNTTTPASFKLTSNIQSTGVKKCISYWETLPTGEYVYWTDCGFYTGPKD